MKKIIYSLILCFVMGVFMIGCKDKTGDYGELIIPDMKIYTNFPDCPTPTFTNPEYECEITYTVLDDQNIVYEDGYFHASEMASATVEAKTEYHTTSFEVVALEYKDAKQTFYLDRVASIQKKWLEAGKPTGGTLFVGDSFFDTEFFSNFYDMFGDSNAFTHGVSSSTSTDWEIFASRLIYPVKPANIVMHLGTNNLFDDMESSTTALENLHRLVNTIHERLPETNIYYFAIEPRAYAIGGVGNFNQLSYGIISGVNKGMKEFCLENDWMNFLDVTSNCYINGILVNESFFRDGCHPKLENYSYYINALKEAGLRLNVNSTFSDTKEFSIPVVNQITDANQLIRANNKTVSKNYSITGNFKIKDIKTNGHIQFSLDETNRANRFLLWDDDSNGTLVPGYTLDDVLTPRAGDAVLVKDKEYSFEIVVTEKHAYFYVNSKLEFVFLNVNACALYIGAENTAVDFYNLNVIDLSDNKEWENILSRSEISDCEGTNVTTTKPLIK